MAEKFKKNSILKPIVKYAWDKPIKKIKKTKQIGLKLVTILLVIGVVLNIIIAAQQVIIKKINDNQNQHISFIYKILLENNLVKYEE